MLKVRKRCHFLAPSPTSFYIIYGWPQRQVRREPVEYYVCVLNTHDFNYLTTGVFLCTNTTYYLSTTKQTAYCIGKVTLELYILSTLRNSSQLFLYSSRLFVLFVTTFPLIQQYSNNHTYYCKIMSCFLLLFFVVVFITFGNHVLRKIA